MIYKYDEGGSVVPPTAGYADTRIADYFANSIPAPSLSYNAEVPALSYSPPPDYNQLAADRAADRRSLEQMGVPTENMANAMRQRDSQNDWQAPDYDAIRESYGRDYSKWPGALGKGMDWLMGTEGASAADLEYIRQNPGQSPDKFNWLFGTGRWEPKHATDVSHSQAFGENRKAQGDFNESGLGRDFNYDRYGNMRTEIPRDAQGNMRTDVYWNSTTGAWTNKADGVPVGGSINSERDLAAEKAARDTWSSKADDTQRRIIAGQHKYDKPTAEEAAATRAAAEARAVEIAARNAEAAAVAQRNRDRQSDGDKKQAAANRAQLDKVKKQYGGLHSGGRNEGGSVVGGVPLSLPKGVGILAPRLSPEEEAERIRRWQQLQSLRQANAQGQSGGSAMGYLGDVAKAYIPKMLGMPFNEGGSVDMPELQSLKSKDGADGSAELTITFGRKAPLSKAQ